MASREYRLRDSQQATWFKRCFRTEMVTTTMMIMMMVRRRRGDHEAAGDGDDDVDEHDKHDGADLHACCHEKMVSMLLSRQYFSLCWRVVVRLPCIVAYAIWLRRRRTSFLGLFSFLLFRSTACVLHGFFEDLFSVFVVRSFF